MDRVQVLEKMQPILNLDVRPVDHLPATRVNVTPEMVIFRPGRGGRTMEVEQEGLRSLAQFVDFPMGFNKKLSPDTFGRVATELLAHKQRYDITTKEGRIVAFQHTIEHRNLNPERVLKNIEGGIRGEVNYHRVTLQDHTVRLEIIGTKQEAVVRGDLVSAGALVQFSPIGTVAPSVQSYVQRLVCTNGMVSNDILREFGYTGGDDGDIFQWFRQSTREAYNSIGQIVRRCQQMVNEHIPPADRPMMLEDAMRRAGLPPKARDAVRSMAIENSPENTYQMMNLITFASSHILKHPHEIARAQQSVAVFQDQSSHARVCPLCHRQQINGSSSN